MRKVAVTPQTFAPPQPEPAPYGVDFQGMLLKVLLSDAAFARGVIDYITPQFFQNPAHSWAWYTALAYREKYSAFPSLNLLVDMAGRIEPQYAPVYQATLDKVRQEAVSDEQWLRDQTLEWIRKNVFMRAFYDVKDMWNAGERTKAYDRMRDAMSVVDNVQWQSVDRGWYNREEYIERYIARQEGTTHRPCPTGIPELDIILEGGPRPGFLGSWVAYPKVGKTTMLTNLGSVSVRAGMMRTLHVVLEGSRLEVEGRYDAIFTQELYSVVKAGDVDAKKYSRAVKELELIRNMLVVRGFTDDWDTSIIQIDEDMKDLRRTFGWDPETIIIDYGDLLRGRPKPGGYKSETQEQTEAFKDMKRLANRGYRVWTASQARRPDKDDWDIVPTELKSKDIADCYAKVRICDFIGSLNQTRAEREVNEMRLYPELYRHNDTGGHTIRIRSNFETMTFEAATGESKAANFAIADPKSKPAELGYVQRNNGI